MKITICPLTYEPISPERKYSVRGLKKLAPTLQHLEDFPFTANEQRKQAVGKQISKISIQGVQPKLLAKLNIKNNCFELAELDSAFILKPQNDLYEKLPENEDLSMRLAASVGIETPLHGLIYCQDNSLTYFIKRFDRTPKQKIAVEDFCQLAAKKTEDKYNFSMERLIPVIEQYCTFPMLEKAKFFQRALFNFIIGNEAMHLKNFSLIRRNNKVELAPAYDFLNTTLAIGSHAEEMALPLNGRKKNLRRKDFIDYFGRQQLELNQKTVDKLLQQIVVQIPYWRQLIEAGFLTLEMKKAYIKLIDERLKILLTTT